ncbi:hypothetical protein ACGWIJ_000789 [Enterococcus hirae]|uniref:hypothetical protein n=1 Tax=Enterococcus TaxID=1350 RepID=UPI0019961DAE|nr:hypothetical protein [Enterococcus faecium]MBC9706609.1 hypothetical protein [Enterococcus sp.]DAL86262.1 MAG TPA: hypothetical protein [Caudoviricetes sp.]EGP4987280.1 hypothetical protein [Enterococcus faecium]MDA3770849.1 hypothetical protein [Enterococcus faecium]MEB6013741.1 hypothetical protein [Enterococcus faecium]
MGDGAWGFLGVIFSVIVSWCIAHKNLKNTVEQNQENREIQEKLEKNQRDFQNSINKSRIEFEREMTQKQIDANLKAKARIEWITEVRKMSANLISSLVDIKNMNTDYEEKLAEISKEAELLKLYFGSYKTDEIKSYDLKVLMNDESNDGKNPHIFLYIDDLLQIYGTKGRKEIARQKNIYSRLQKETKTILRKLNEISQDKVVAIDEEGDPYIDQVAIEGHEAEYIYLDDQFSIAASKENSYRRKIEEYYNRTEEFEKIISVYLKLEWNRAKNGD